MLAEMKYRKSNPYFNFASNRAMKPLSAAERQVTKASGVCESLAQLIPIPLHPANLGQLLEDTTLLLVGKELLELPLFVVKTLGARRHPRGRHGEQNVGAIHPVDMRHHRGKSTGGDILEAQVLLDCFMKHLDRPAEPISKNDLACCYSQVIAG